MLNYNSGKLSQDCIYTVLEELRKKGEFEV